MVSLRGVDAQDLASPFERGNFAAVRARANAILSDPNATEDDRKLALDYRGRTEPPGAARFALLVTLALVTILSVYFAFVRRH